MNELNEYFKRWLGEDYLKQKGYIDKRTKHKYDLYITSTLSTLITVGSLTALNNMFQNSNYKINSQSIDTMCASFGATAILMYEEYYKNINLFSFFSYK